MEKVSCEFKYTTTSDSKSKIVTVKINILDFKRIMESHNPIKNKSFGITKANYAEDADQEIKFGITMKYEGRERDMMEIHYLAPSPVFVKAYCYMLDRGGSRNLPIAIKHDRSAVSEWQLLAVILKQDMNNSISAVATTLGRLCFEFQFILDNNISAVDEYKRMPKTNLTSNLENLLNNATLSDVTIKSVEGTELPAHKAILIARSEVIKANFDHGTTETETNIIKSDFETEVLQAVLHYIYTDRPPVEIGEMPDKLLVAADYYHLDGLKFICEKTLYEQLSVENALKTLEIADLLSATNLKKLTLKFINDGHLEDVIKTDAWKSFNSVDLMKSICEYKCI